jgi:hypothetical protein
MAKRTLWRVIIVKIRMWYADIRGHHGHRWDYEPSDHYMGRHPKNRK